MKSASFIFDRRLYELLQDEGRPQFTTRDLRDAYAECSGLLIPDTDLGENHRH